MKIAVYGTLKQGYGNHRLLFGFEKMKDAVVNNFGLMYSYSTSGFPVAYPCEDSKAHVEIYDIGDNEGVLRNLDSLEGYRENNPKSSMYIRTPVITECGEEVHMYVGNPEFWDFDKMQPTTMLEGGYSWP